MDQMKMDGFEEKDMKKRHSQKAEHGSFRGQTSPLKATDGGVLEGGGRCGGPAQAAAPHCVGGAPQKPPLPSTTPNIAISFVTSQPYFSNSLLYCPTSPHCTGKKPNQSFFLTIQTSIICNIPHKTNYPHILNFFILPQWYYMVPLPHPGVDCSPGARKFFWQEHGTPLDPCLRVASAHSHVRRWPV